VRSGSARYLISLLLPGHSHIQEHRQSDRGWRFWRVEGGGLRVEGGGTRRVEGGIMICAPAGSWLRPPALGSWPDPPHLR
jgi:uncharacterized cupin superfamily protein